MWEESKALANGICRLCGLDIESLPPIRSMKLLIDWGDGKPMPILEITSLVTEPGKMPEEKVLQFVPKTGSTE